MALAHLFELNQFDGGEYEIACGARDDAASLVKVPEISRAVWTPEERRDFGLPGGNCRYLRAVAITRHLHDNRTRAFSANKDVQTLSRIFRLARVRWGLTTFNACEDIEYLPESPATST